MESLVLWLILMIILMLMKMNNLNDMTDLSFTQTSRAMTSRPLNRSSNNYKSIWQIAAENNVKPKVFIDRRAKGLRSNSTVFMGC